MATNRQLKLAFILGYTSAVSIEVSSTLLGEGKLLFPVNDIPKMIEICNREVGDQLGLGEVEPEEIREVLRMLGLEQFITEDAVL